MRAVVITGPGGPEVLELQDVDEPTPRAGELRVRIAAFGVNRADLLQRRGRYPPPAGAPRDIPGLEFAGVVDAVGAASDARWHEGDRVMGIAGGGTYAEAVTVPAGHVVSVPDDFGFVEAAAIPEAYVTAFDALQRVLLQADEWLLIHAIGSGVGTAALQLAQARGARCIGTSRTREKLHRALALGLHVGIDTTTDDLVADVRRATGEGVHAAIDLVGGTLFPHTLAAMRERGRVVVVGLTAGRTAELDLGLLLRHRLRVEGTVLRSRSPAEKTALMTAFARAVMPLVAQRVVRPMVDRTFRFDDVTAAHAYMESNANFGKIVVEVA